MTWQYNSNYVVFGSQYMKTLIIIYPACNTQEESHLIMHKMRMNALCVLYYGTCVGDGDG